MTTARKIITYTRPWMYPAQEAAIFHDKRYGIIEASTKAGKTSACLVWSLEENLIGPRGSNHWWVAPVYSQAIIAFRRFRDGLDRRMYKSNASDLSITLLANGYPWSTLWFKSGEKPDNLYGEDVRSAIIDEASRLREESWHAVRSTLTATRGKMRIIGNVKGRKNWFYNLARRAESGDPDMHYAKLTAHDAVKGGVLAEEEIKSAQRDLPEQVFRELYLAEPSDDGGNPFGLDSIKACVRPLSTNEPVVFGGDLAKSVDWSVLIGLDKDKRVAKFLRIQEAWRETLVKFSTGIGRKPAAIDSTGVGDPIVESLQRDTNNSQIEGYKFTQESKQRLMEGLAVAIQHGEIMFPEGPIKNELDYFEYEYTRTGVKYSAPQGYHDDCVCALALANYKMGQSRGRQPVKAIFL